MNLERVTDYSAGYMFSDAFKASRPWVPMLYNTTTHDYTMDRQQTLPISLNEVISSILISRRRQERSRPVVGLLLCCLLVIST